MTSTSDEKNLYKFHFSFYNCQKSASNRKFYINQLTQYVYTDREAATALKRAFAAYRPAPPLPFCPSPPTAQTDLPTQTAEPKKTDRQQKKAALLQTGRLSKEKRERTLAYSSAVVSSNPQITLKFCTAAPAAPLIRLSIAEIVITREPTTRTVRWQRFV